MPLSDERMPPCFCRGRCHFQLCHLYNALLLLYMASIWQVLFDLHKRVTGTVGNLQFSGEKKYTRLDHYIREIAGCQGQKASKRTALTQTAPPEPATAVEFFFLQYAMLRSLSKEHRGLFVHGWPARSGQRSDARLHQVP
jgi:hypothetical protein